MKTFLSVMLLILWSQSALGVELSAQRQLDENYGAARERSYLERGLHAPVISPLVLGQSTAEALQVPLSDLDISEAPELDSYRDLEEIFFYVRDRRWLRDQQTGSRRRLTWLYPDDGCYARAEMMKHLVAQKSYPRPAKVFAFGKLTVNTPNSPRGYVAWWYHVAISYRLGDSLYVLDPAIEPTRPLTIAEWNQVMGGETHTFGYSLCSAHTFIPDSDCFEKQGLRHVNAIKFQSAFLSPEWQRLIDLGRQPERELLDQPPWLN